MADHSGCKARLDCAQSAPSHPCVVVTLSATAVLATLQKAAKEWRVGGASPPEHTGVCPLCFVELAWLEEAPTICGLPHELRHPLSVLVESELRAAEADAIDHGWREGGPINRRSDIVKSDMDAARFHFRQHVLQLMFKLESTIELLRQHVVEPEVGTYVARESYAEPPWPWTLR